MRSSILLVDDEVAILALLSLHLRDQGYSVDVAASREAAEALLAARQYEVVAVDLSLSGARGTEGRELLHLARRQQPDAVRILISAHIAPQDWWSGSADEADIIVLTKPTPLQEISQIIATALQAKP